jgi:putative aldouronate transport system permease protein
MSISSPEHVLQQDIWFLPKGFSVGAYKLVFENPDVWRAYYNTIWYTLVGTTINVFMTVIGAYPLSRKNLIGRNFFTFFITFTMFFSGGLIPSFLLIKNLGLYNTRWAMVLPGAVSAWYIIIARTYFQSSIPDGLIDAAKIDGCNDISILFRIVIPLSAPIIAVLALFYAVGHWNSFFNALLYLPDKNLQPIQIYLVRVLIQASPELIGQIQDEFARSAYFIQLKYAVIIITILPIICVYPFLQKYFVKGVMIGAIKE